MKAYISEIEIADDDSDIIATIRHDADSMFKVKLKKDKYITSDEFRFIANVLDLPVLTKELEVNKKDKY